MRCGRYRKYRASTRTNIECCREGKKWANNLDVLCASCISWSVSMSPRSLQVSFPRCPLPPSRRQPSRSPLVEGSSPAFFAPANTVIGHVTSRYTWSIVPYKPLGLQICIRIEGSLLRDNENHGCCYKRQLHCKTRKSYLPYVRKLVQLFRAISTRIPA